MLIWAKLVAHHMQGDSGGAHPAPANLVSQAHSDNVTEVAARTAAAAASEVDAWG